ncbi:formyltransferase family protein [Neisseriaceae bacterium TC5R-5]|nr:formyltransferase family protein [Neisseriaceae bacterium TC5R-5]
MRLVIVGQKWLGAALFEQCQASGYEVITVITPEVEDRLFRMAQSHHVPVRVESERVSAADISECDVLVAAHAHCYIDASARGQARYGAIGYHPSLLPRHRGRDAVQWAVRMREPVTGGTVYQLNDGADTGPILRQDWCHIRPHDTATELWRRDLAPMGLRLFAQVLQQIAAGKVCPVPQDESLATWEPALRARKMAG